VLCVAGCLSGCVTTLPPAPSPSQVEALQTREFENDKAIVFASTLSAFQELGYIIDSADENTGLITARSPTDDKTSFLEGLSGVKTTGRTRATAVVDETRPGFVRVRLDFVDSRHRSNPGTFAVTNPIGSGTGDRETLILDPEIYEIAFEEVTEAIVVRSRSDD
jgi:hypothetical protein